MARPGWSPWRTITAFGFVSLSADLVYEGMRSVTGPLLASLGASALVVGLVTGAGEGIALVLRLVAGRWADRSGRHWRLTVVGYAMTAVCVPLLAVTPFVGAAGLGLATTLILLERTGKAVRSPSKAVLLSGVASQVGRGRGFGVHKALDQVGAFAGPLVVAGFLALTGELWIALVVLVVPGAVAMLLLGRLRAVLGGDPEAAAVDVPDTGDAIRLGRAFACFAGSSALSTVGLMTFGVIAFQLTERDLVDVAVVPLVYALGMAVQALSALATGAVYDRSGPRVLLVVPVAVVVVPPLALADDLTAVLLGVTVWGLVTGVQDSTVKALVADLVPRRRLGTAYGVYAAAQGGAALTGGLLAGALSTDHIAALTVVVAASQVVALALLISALRRHRPSTFVP